MILILFKLVVSKKKAQIFELHSFLFRISILIKDRSQLFSSKLEV